MGRKQVKASEKKNIAEYNTQLRQLRTLHLKDADARKELCDMMNEMKQRLRTAATDIQAAGERQALIQSLTEHVRAQIDKKYESLLKAETLISDCMKKEIVMRAQMLELAEKMLLADAWTPTSDYESAVSRFREKLLSEDNVVKIEQAVSALRDSMGVRVDLERSAVSNNLLPTINCGDDLNIMHHPPGDTVSTPICLILAVMCVRDCYEMLGLAHKEAISPHRMNGLLVFLRTPPELLVGIYPKNSDQLVSAFSHVQRQGF